jgi:hypothetical protein
MTEKLPQSPEEWKQYIREKKEKEAREEAKRREAAEKEAAKRAWVKDGGTEWDFAKAWPEIRDAKRKARIQKTTDKARAATHANLKNSF